MESLSYLPTEFSPEIILDHEQQVFSINGNSRPEDVRELYSPVLEWLHNYRLFLKNNGNTGYSGDNPLTFKFNLDYFNSSSAKFLYDIVEALKQIREDGIPTEVMWIWDHEDVDMKEAGEDLAYLAEFDFTYVTKNER